VSIVLAISMRYIHDWLYTHFSQLTHFQTQLFSDKGFILSTL